MKAPIRFTSPSITPRHCQHVQALWDLPEDFILFVSTIEPRKNVGGLLRAYRRLRDDYKLTPALVLAGAQGWLSEDILALVDELNLRPYCFFLGRVNSPDLRFLYNAARCLVHPAFYEGFGLTPLEAMACGTPVIVSNVSSLPEVVGDAALLVDPQNDEESHRGAVAAADRSEAASHAAGQRLAARGRVLLAACGRADDGSLSQGCELVTRQSGGERLPRPTVTFPNGAYPDPDPATAHPAAGPHRHVAGHDHPQLQPDRRPGEATRC